ncbi:hypothetical protein [Actinomadura fibrosa]|uniref:Uncharacterized protein n=1 Tax=Actinomadura fibrosa TaxID=111802 RepID=A0ABW2XF35_9ACTN|nr:hypothetical protein [Actinomadura fibrosa]
MDNAAGLSPRTGLGGAVGTATLAPAKYVNPSALPQVLIATNEPWGTYHVRSLLAEAERRDMRLTQLVPDRSHISLADPVPVARPEDALHADLLVVSGAGDWPLECAARFPQLPLMASSLAYLGPQEAPGAARLRRRLHGITSSSPAESRAFASHLGTRRHIQVVGSPQTDDLPVRRPEAGLVLVLTSVTHPDGTGTAAPGTELLLSAAKALHESGRRILVGLHPRENRTLWKQYEVSDVPSVQASARADVAIGIPGTAFPLVVAVGTPAIGCVGPALSVPDYLLSVCSSTIDNAVDAVAAVAEAQLPDDVILADAVGPIGNSARRLLNAWACHGRGPALSPR